MKNQETSSWRGLRLPIPWSSDAQLTAVLSDRAPRQNPFTQLRSLLALLEPAILKNLTDFQAFQLSVVYLESAIWREAVLTERTDGVALIHDIAERDQALLDSLTRDWNGGRPADAPAKSEPISGLAPKDQLLYQWKQAAAYSASLANQPDRFSRLLESAKS